MSVKVEIKKALQGLLGFTHESALDYAETHSQTLALSRPALALARFVSADLDDRTLRLLENLASNSPDEKMQAAYAGQWGQEANRLMDGSLATSNEKLIKTIFNSAIQICKSSNSLLWRRSPQPLVSEAADFIFSNAERMSAKLALGGLLAATEAQPVSAKPTQDLNETWKSKLQPGETLSADEAVNFARLGSGSPVLGAVSRQFINDTGYLASTTIAEFSYRSALKNVDPVAEPSIVPGLHSGWVKAEEDLIAEGLGTNALHHAIAMTKNPIVAKSADSLIKENIETVLGEKKPEESTSWLADVLSTDDCKSDNTTELLATLWFELWKKIPDRNLADREAAHVVFVARRFAPESPIIPIAEANTSQTYVKNYDGNFSHAGYISKVAGLMAGEKHLPAATP